MRLNNTIKVERARHKLSQTQLAEKINTSRQTIHAVETGKDIPGANLALKMAAFFKIKVEDLFTLKEKLC